MEIGKVYQTADPATKNIQTQTRQVGGGKSEAPSSSQSVVQQDFQVHLQDGLKGKLIEFTKLLQTRDQLIRSLPDDVKTAVLALLEQISVDSALPQGVGSLLTGQKEMINQLKNMATLLEFAGTLQKDEHADIRIFLQKIIEQTTGNLGLDPEQSAKELLQLAKQLSSHPPVLQGDFKQVAETILQKTLPANLEQLTPDQQKIIEQLSVLLELDAGEPLQELAKKNNFLQLSNVLTVIKAVDAWQFKNIQPKTLRAAADLLDQLGQDISVANAENTGKLEEIVKKISPQVTNPKEIMSEVREFIKTLPKTMSSQQIKTALAQFIKTVPTEGNYNGRIILALEKWIDTLPNEMNAKDTMVAHLNEFIKNAPLEMRNKQILLTRLEHAVETLPDGMDSSENILTVVKDAIKNLPLQVASQDELLTQFDEFLKEIPAKPSNKEVISAQLEQLADSFSSDSNGKGTGLTQLGQFMKSLPVEFSAKGTMVSQLDDFLQTLPPEIGKALQQALQQGDIADHLRGLANTFRNAAVLNKNMTGVIQSFIEKMTENFSIKVPLSAGQGSELVVKLNKQFTNNVAIVNQIKTLISELKTQLFPNNVILSDREQHTFDRLAKILVDHIPQAIQDGAIKYKMDDLPKIWILLKVLGGKQWQGNQLQNRQESASVIKELAQSIYKSSGLMGEKQAQHSTLSFSVPLRVAEGVYYPAHLHIYHEEKNNKNQGDHVERQFETWLRVCVETEHIGVVDSVFRLYGNHQLDVRVIFPDPLAAEEFTQDIPKIREHVTKGKLDLNDIIVMKT